LTVLVQRYKVSDKIDMTVDSLSVTRYGCITAIFCMVLPRTTRGLEIDRFPIQGVLPSTQKIHICRINVESEQARKPNPQKLKKCYWWRWWRIVEGIRKDVYVYWSANHISRL